MARKKKRPPYISEPESRIKKTKLGGGNRKRSYEVPLLWLGAAALIGFPLLRDATSDQMRRNRYADRYSCECDYGSGRCNFDYERRVWLGPWYARDASARKADDPGQGQCRATYRYSGGGGYGGGNYSGARTAESGDYRPPNGVDSGYRGGFGGAARVRAAGS